MTVLIGTPAYNGLIHMDYLDSIMDMQSKGISFDCMKIGNESLITRGRNTILSYFHAIPKYTHLFFLDADIGIKAEEVLRLFSHKVDVIGAPVPLKGYDFQGNKVYNISKPVPCGDLYEVDKVGTAVLILSRKAVNSLVEGAEQYKGNPLTRGNLNIPVMYDVFKTGVENGEYLPEDFYVCKRLKELGYKIFVDDTVIPTHTGMFKF